MKMTKWQRKYIFVYFFFFYSPAVQLCHARAPDAARDLLILLSSRRQREREKTCQPASHPECRTHAQTKHFQQSEIPTCVHARNR